MLSWTVIQDLDSASKEKCQREQLIQEANPTHLYAIDRTQGKASQNLTDPSRHLLPHRAIPGRNTGIQNPNDRDLLDALPEPRRRHLQGAACR